MPDTMSQVTVSPVVWNVHNMERKLPDGDVPPDGQVYTLHYTATLSEQGEVASLYGSIGLGDPSPDAFTPYDQITKEQAIEWVKSALGEEQVLSIELGLENQIQAQLNPKQATGIPW